MVKASETQVRQSLSQSQSDLGTISKERFYLTMSTATATTIGLRNSAMQRSLPKEPNAYTCISPDPIIPSPETTSKLHDDENFLKRIRHDNVERVEPEGSFESDNTVIHYQYSTPKSQHNYRHSLDLEMDLQEYAIDEDIFNTENLEGSTQTHALSIDDLMDSYVANYLQFRNNVYNQLRSTLEEFKFDVFTNHLTMPDTSSRSRYSTVDDNNNGDDVGGIERECLSSYGDDLYFKISDTPYMVLIHSIRPKLISFLILSHLRRRLRTAGACETAKYRRANIKLFILAVSILNMSNNAQLSLTLYFNVLMNRTRQILQTLGRFEKYVLLHMQRRSSASNSAQLNLLTSTLHTLVNLIVKKTRTMMSYGGMNINSLWQFLIIYGLNGDVEEGKIVRNVVGANCSCTWGNEPLRLLRALQYVKKVLLCVVMSVMECNDKRDEVVVGGNTERDVVVFMKKFWRRFGYDYGDYEFCGKWCGLTMATRWLGVSHTLVELNTIVKSLHSEICSMDGGSQTEENGHDDVVRLDVVSEHNEDERVKVLSGIVEAISCKIDLVELGLDGGAGFTSLSEDITKLVKYYDSMTRGSFSAGGKSHDSFELKKLRMSEILLDDDETIEDFSRNDAKKGDRRSSGMNFKLLNLVKENSAENDEDIVDDGRKELDSAFKDTLEKLCLANSNNGGSAPAIRKPVTSPTGEHRANTGTATGSERTDEGYLEFQRELRARLAGEQQR